MARVGTLVTMESTGLRNKLCVLRIFFECGKVGNLCLDMAYKYGFIIPTALEKSSAILATTHVHLTFIEVYAKT